MSDDYPTKSRSDQTVRHIAEQIKASSGLSRDGAWDIVGYLKRSELRTYFGIKTLKIEVLPDAEMREDDGLTTFEPRHVTIQIKRSVYANAILETADRGWSWPTSSVMR